MECGKFSDCVYVIPTVDKPIKIVIEDEFAIENNDDMTFTIKRKATPKEIAEWIGVPVDDVLNGKIGMCILDEDDKETT